MSYTALSDVYFLSSDIARENKTTQVFIWKNAALKILSFFEVFLFTLIKCYGIIFKN